MDKQKGGSAIKQKIYITLGTICLICACSVNLDKLGLLPGVVLAALFWVGFIICARKIEIPEEWEESE